MPTNPHRLRRRATIGTVLVLLLAVAGYAAYNTYRHTTPAAAPACQAGTGAGAISLETDQASIAATIAGVAARYRLPRQAVTIAYAAALQESHMHNLDYGDQDSVGVFQQRPSQGWGTTAEIEDPVYATTRFFEALVQVPGYTKLPVDQAAQDVQHSADGSAYQQYAGVAALLAAYFTGQSPHDVSCWYAPDPSGGADLAEAVREMADTFGPDGRDGVVVAVTTDRSAHTDGSMAVVHAQRDAAWTVAGWLVTHASEYQITEVQYAGYEWIASDGSMGWQRDSGSPAHGSIVAG